MLFTKLLPTHNPKFSLTTLSLFSTKTSLKAEPGPIFQHPLPDPETPDLLSVPITNAPYWTRKIHHLCTVHRQVDDALRLLNRLRLRGYHPDSLNLSSVIHGLCDSNRFDEAHNRFILFLLSNCVPDERTCNVIVARLLDSKSPFATLRVLYHLFAVKTWFVPNLVNYNRLIYQFCEASQLHVAHRLFFDMINRGHRPNVVSFTTLIGGYCQVGEIGLAYKLFDEMRGYGLVPNSLTYSVLIRGVFRKRELDRGRELMSKLWDTMKHEQNASVNSAAFSNLVDCLCREGLFGYVFHIAEDMPQGKSVDEEFVYGHMIDSLCRVRRNHAAARVLYIMRKRGYSPSLVSYNSIVHGLCLERGCMRAFQLLQEGIEFGYRPSEYTYKVLVEALCREMDLDKAKQVLQLMLNKDGVDRTRMYNIYLRAVFLVNNPTEILNLLVFMLQSNCQPDVITLNTVLNGFCKMQRLDEALKVLNDMMMEKICAPDEVSFTTVINGLLNVGRTQEALNLFDEVMVAKGIKFGVVTYNTVLRGLFKLNLAEEAMEFFNRMRRNKVDANCTTYSIVIDGLCKCEQIDEAKKFWDEVVWPSRVHDDFVYASILKGLCTRGSLKEACHFLYELVDSGVTPNIVSYNIVIDSACKMRLRRETYQIVRELRKNGLTPDAVTWRILDKLHNPVKKRSAEAFEYSDAHSLERKSGKEKQNWFGC